MFQYAAQFTPPIRVGTSPEPDKVSGLGAFVFGDYYITGMKAVKII
jgi:hypothetical protein